MAALRKAIFTSAFVCINFFMIGFVLQTQPVFAADIGRIFPETLNGNRSGWAILDARPPRVYNEGHLPGAHSFSWEDYTRVDEKGIPYRLLPPEQMAEALGRLGISEQTSVVVYADAETSWGGEGWACWVLARLGHQGPIRLLDGGIQSWQARRYPMETNAPGSKEAVRYRYSLCDAVMISAETLKDTRGSLQVVDTRSLLEWIKGRIPGATRIEWEQFYTGKHRRPLSADAVRDLLVENGIDPEKPVVYYCTGGIRSGYAWLVHQLAGLPTPVNFEGGMEAWERVE